LLALHAERGVEVRAGVGVAAVLGDAHVTGVRLDDGAELPADAVLVAIGSEPNVEWLHGSGLTLADGVVCDEHCVAAPGVYAAGDVARWHHAGLGRDLRVEHRQNAADQGRAVARHILGERVPFTPVPFFWTDHFGVKVQLAGTIPPGAEEEVLEDDAERGRLVVAFTVAGATAGVVGWNAPDRVTAHRRELAARAVAA
ncbi:MAG TPA: FAD-dependent oxidoreductase, partial [Baekduia sp.]